MYKLTWLLEFSSKEIRCSPDVTVSELFIKLFKASEYIYDTREVLKDVEMSTVSMQGAIMDFKI